MNIANILKNLRLENNLTQQELSSRLNIGQATIACYESGQREPHIQILLAYADYFECSLDYLTGRTDDLGNIVINSSKNNITTLTNNEQKLLKYYHQLTNTNKAKLFGYLEGILST